MPFAQNGIQNDQITNKTQWNDHTIDDNQSVKYFVADFFTFVKTCNKNLVYNFYKIPNNILNFYFLKKKSFTFGEAIKNTTQYVV